MSASGGDRPPTKKLKIGDGGGQAPPKNLREEYLRILNLMLEYQNSSCGFPNATSPEFHQFVQGKGLANISQERLTRALLFMEESFRDNVRRRGMNTHFFDRYLEERFQLSQIIWGQLNQDSDDKHGEGARLNQEPDDDHEKGNLVEDPYDLDDVVDEEQEVMDVAILRALYEFKTGTGGAIPQPDSDVFYNFLVNQPVPNIPQDLLVDRILMLEENFNRIETTRLMEFKDTLEFANPQRREIYNLSSKIWGYDDRVDEQYDGAQVIDDGLHRKDFRGEGNAGDEQDDQGAGAGNGGDEQDGQGGAEAGGGEEDGQRGVEGGGVEEDDLGGVED